ncbi:uncharacterized protein LACBIDRAFT_308887 [Laccaria bicolor S238N-H82]|uniref:Predicted protein n=1 Tax=Laccaria bicolor (strain S238N-H82 / ATCC MYA-4686) TaxID=486041 RepID=B0CV02_LACBS|nr:uncharacterized protein LACBIDRAFT_308887 [Laccaria bicolor S238N-H82]EDR13660.1 predicted protein [Laccaria bicolor S238N-H82]|eukprot:XP_001876158.1 predicted protein [Laccaria bicolor S238N-H82]
MLAQNDKLAPKLETIISPWTHDFYKCYVSPTAFFFALVRLEKYCAPRTRTPRARKPHVDYYVAFLLIYLLMRMPH